MDPVAEAETGEVVLHRRHERCGAAQVDLDRGRVLGDAAQVVLAEEADQVTGGRLVGEPQQQSTLGQGVGEAAQLVEVAHVGGGVAVVDEGDRAAVAFVDEGAQHGQDRGDPAAAAHHHQVVAPFRRSGEHEVAPGLGQADDVPGAGVVHQVATDPPGGVGLDGELQGSVGPVRGPGQAEAALVDDTGDVDADHHVLAGPEPGPRVVGGQGQRDGADHLALDGHHLGSGLANHPAGIDQLQVAVHAVGSGQLVDQPGGQRPANDPPGTDGGERSNHDIDSIAQ